jgi:hypothetical protein
MNLYNWKPDFFGISSLFEPLAVVGNSLKRLSHWPDLSDLADLINSSSRKIVTRSGKSICFVYQKKTKRTLAEQYEARIYLTGEVQTRIHNWHDLFNALVWITFPNTKAELNQLHYQALTQEWHDKEKRRGPLRDAATLFDESGVVVVCNDNNLIKLLEDFDWKSLFWTHREALKKRMKFFIFGHGLYEKALNPYVGMTGKGAVLSVDADFFNQSLSVQLISIDRILADFIRQQLTATSDLRPIPVLGYPGWSPDNINESYYDNRDHFRPRPILPRKN